MSYVRFVWVPQSTIIWFLNHHFLGKNLIHLCEVTRSPVLKLSFQSRSNEYIHVGDDYRIHTKGTSTTSDVFYEPWLQNEKHTPFCCTWRESASINFLSLIWFLMKFCQHLITILLSDLYVVIYSTLFVFVLFKTEYSIQIFQLANLQRTCSILVM